MEQWQLDQKSSQEKIAIALTDAMIKVIEKYGELEIDAKECLARAIVYQIFSKKTKSENELQIIFFCVTYVFMEIDKSR